MELKAQRRTALNGCHRDASHQGKKRTLSLVADRFWWPGVQEAVENAVCVAKLMGEVSLRLQWSPSR